MRGTQFFLAVILLAFSNHARATDDRTDIGDYAWFLGDAPVTVCVDVAANFGISSDAVMREVTASINQWVAFINATQVNMLPARAKGLFLATSFALKAGCQPSDGFRMYFGTVNDDTSPIIKLYQNSPGFAHRIAYDAQNGRSTGMIWIAPRGSLSQTVPFPQYPDWALPYRLHAILLHTLGHVFGISHIPGTIMKSEMGALIGSLNPPDDASANRVFAQISQGMDLNPLHFPDSPGGITLVGYLRGQVSPAIAATPINQQAIITGAYKRLTGLDTTSNVNTKLVTNPDLTGTLTLGSGSMTKTLTLTFFKNATDRTRGEYFVGKVFSMSRLFNGVPVNFSTGPFSRTYNGSLKTADGKDLPIMLEANHLKNEGGVYRLRAVIDGVLVTLLE